MKGLYFYKLVSPYQEDVTKDCKLTINEIDHNFVTLKDVDIKEISFDEQKKVIDFVRNNGDEINVDLSSMVEGITTDLRVDYDSVDGIITIEYNGEKHLINGLVTDDNIVVKALTEVISDGTLSGLGSKHVPLGIAPVEKTGNYRPAYKLIDKINGEFMPCRDHLIKGDRYVTLEEVSDYGFLYDYASVRQINKELKNGWRVPTKQDWDNMLNAIEPCDEYKNHDSALANNVLGKYAGKYLKTKDKWLKTDSCVPGGGGGCSCGCGCKPLDSCDEIFDVEDDTDNTKPSTKPINPCGTDCYKLGLVPAGFFDGCEIVDYFKKRGFYWTTSMINETDVYVKRFDFDKAGVVQHVECPRNYFSLRLVKDYDGSNHLQTEYINGMVYNTVLLPAENTKHGHSIWTASNIAFPNNRYNPIKPNRGEGLSSRRAYFINEWDGFDWQRKEILEGESIVLFEGLNKDKNIEYRVMNGKLYSVADTIFDKVMETIKPEIDRIDEIIGEGVKDENGKIVDLTTVVGSGFTDENGERVSITDKVQNIDDVLGTGFTDENGEIVTVTDKLANEIADRLAADKQFREDLDQEIRDREEADKQLQANIDEESRAREEADNFIHAEMDTIENNVGLTEDGNYIKRENSNFINDAETVMGAVDMLDNALRTEENERKTQDKNTNTGVGLDFEGHYIPRTESFFINGANSVMEAVDELDVQLHIEQTERMWRDDVIEAGAGLSKEGEYVHKDNANYIDKAISINDAVNRLDDALRTEENERKDQDNVLEENVGLDHNGLYIPRLESNYLKESKTVMGAIDDLDAALKKEEQDRIEASNGIQEELDKSQASVGLEEDGSYAKRTEKRYIKDAETVMGAVETLDDSLSNEAKTRERYDDNIKVAVGLNDYYYYIKREGSHYIDGATSVMGAVDTLDESLKSEEEDREAQDDVIEANVGLDEDGNYVKTDGKFTSNSETVMGAIKDLDLSLEIEEQDRINQDDKIELNVGLDEDGNFMKRNDSYCINEAETVVGAINLLDLGVYDENCGRVNEDNVTRRHVGLDELGHYVKRPESNNIKDAETVMGAVDLLDSALDTERDARVAQDNRIEAGVGLDENGDYIKLTDQDAHYIHGAENLAHAVKKLDSALKVEENNRVTVTDKIKKSVGLDAEGEYVRTEGEHIKFADSIADSINMLDSSLSQEEDNRAKQDDKIEKSVGLTETGEYVAKEDANYIKYSESVVGAVETLDSYLGAEENARKDRDKTIQEAIGLNEDGTFKENVGYFTSSASTVEEEIAFVDAALQNETIDREHGDAAVQNELDIAEKAIGLNEDGTYAPTEGNYTSKATTVAGAIDSLDKSLKEEATVREETDTYIKSRLIKEGEQPNNDKEKAFDCANGVLTLFAEDPKHNIVIRLTGDYGVLPYDENEENA